ncbi:MAG: 4a-hydroxytetrahydrobiopterin dehydratase [Opitutae bacterium]|jgi:4a-hydroxytetrahydrobiopterin dehydratase|tara:strand:+ start:114 stop:398 length:285 start_codon:yes stop_codon:yes gene_type:complete
MKKSVSNDEIIKKLSELSDWEFTNDQLKKAYLFTNFREAMGFIIRISYEAEQQNHHPEIYNCYNRVELSLNTHDAGNIVTQKDFNLAHAIDSVL